MSESKTIFVMMSGGVDSSVAASVLMEEGYKVVGVFMKCWSIEQLDSLGVDRELYGCFWEEDSRDAGLVANKLGIPFYVWDFEDLYKKRVVDYMLAEYKNGRTPNPDVMCNSTIKFGIFYQRAMQLGADYVATGHYARIINSKNYANKDFSGFLGGTLIARAKDDLKDQSYFLWGINLECLTKTLFPIGEFAQKSLVRDYAEKHGLITAHKKDSQGLCFIGETPLRELLLQSLGNKEGDIINTEGKVLGSHPGAYLYTIGQRQKLGLSGGPWFVSKIDVVSNIVYVTHIDEEKALYSKDLDCVNLNLHCTSEKLIELSNRGKLSAQIRYRQQPTPCGIEQYGENQCRVMFSEPVRASAIGQSLVIYSDELMLGGVIINSIAN